MIYFAVLKQKFHIKDSIKHPPVPRQSNTTYFRRRIIILLLLCITTRLLRANTSKKYDASGKTHSKDENKNFH